MSISTGDFYSATTARTGRDELARRGDRPTRRAARIAADWTTSRLSAMGGSNRALGATDGWQIGGTLSILAPTD
jgi:hypothetical protein